ncbi:MAG: hypothetical protein DMF95_11905 [Acidobacteria bacterium]|nr:MAG: hypothetical protein DMF95_11905 [Acidobacteriota bacterium]
MNTSVARVAALYDIHGNLPALEAVLEQVREAAVDHIVVGGDVLPGPMARETMQCLLNLPFPVDFIYGNGEVAVLEHLAGRTPARVPEQYRPAIQWPEDFATRYILQPPSAAEMLDLFTRASI